VFAGAAREAVFSKLEVIRRVRADFLPVALKAGAVNQPPHNAEGRLYREIARSKPAPQGICVVNSAGKVLDWALMFDDDRSVLAFLDHAAKRFVQFPDARRPFPAERFMKYPSQKLPDVEDSGEVAAIPERHRRGEHCPGQPPIPRGTLVARVFGRALGEDGKPVADVVAQEHYVEDRFSVPVATQETLARAVAEAGGKRFRLPEDLARLLVGHAFLGQLDVNPLRGAPGERGALKQCEFWAQQAEAGGGPMRLRIEGRSKAEGSSDGGRSGDARLWRHEVQLAWEGIIDLKNDRVTSLLVTARGLEKLQWSNQGWPLKRRADVTHLPAGHAIDQTGGVQYGILGEPVSVEGASDVEAESGQEIPDEARKPLVEALGGPFLVYRDRVQAELKLSDEQRNKLMAQFPVYVQETMKLFEKIQDAPPREREKALQEHRQKSDQRLTAQLNEVLDARQRGRLFQLQLQQAGPFALLGQNEAFLPLEIRDEQRRGFQEVVQEMEKKIQALVQEAEKEGNPEEIRSKVTKLRHEHAARIEALLTPVQRKRWKTLLGKPLDLGD
jgi:hypothetical protein